MASARKQKQKQKQKQKGTFWETVRELRQARQIPRVWTRADIRPYLEASFTQSTINTVPSNQSMTRDGSEMGNYVMNGVAAMAWRVARGQFELIDDPETEDGASGLAGGDVTRKYRVNVVLEHDTYRRALALARTRRTGLENLVSDALLQQLDAASLDEAPFLMRINHCSRPIGVLTPADVADIEFDDDLRSAGLRR
jgi:hypothetical protein